MFFGNNAKAEAARVIADMRGLIDQQMYEFQSLIADLQLSAIAVQGLVDTHKMTDDVAEELRAAATNLKHQLRNARHEADGAVWGLRDLEHRMADLEPDE